MAAGPEQNKAAARAVFEVWNTGELEKLDWLVAADVLHHDPNDPNAAQGLNGMKRTIEHNRRRFPDLKLTVEDQVAEGEKVATRWRGEMTPAERLAAGSAVTVTGITIDRFEDGKIVEAWRSMNTVELLRATGVIAEAGQLRT
jgi:predicted ester cyclase